MAKAGAIAIVLPPGFSLHSAWLPAATSSDLLAQLLQEIPWQQHRVRLFGRELPAPRLSSWHGDPGTRYRYSGQDYQPAPWTDALCLLRDRLRQDFRIDFNSVLVNRYRDGNDAMGWHSDDERELGPEPIIASVNLGAERGFDLRPRQPGPGRLRVPLGHGDLLLMQGRSQQDWQHQVARSRKVRGERINLTFRQIRLDSARG